MTKVVGIDTKVESELWLIAERVHHLLNKETVNNEDYKESGHLCAEFNQSIDSRNYYLSHIGANL